MCQCVAFFQTPTILNNRCMHTQPSPPNFSFYRPFSASNTHSLPPPPIFVLSIFSNNGTTSSADSTVTRRRRGMETGTTTKRNRDAYTSQIVCFSSFFFFFSSYFSNKYYLQLNYEPPYHHTAAWNSPNDGFLRLFGPRYISFFVNYLRFIDCKRHRGPKERAGKEMRAGARDVICISSPVPRRTQSIYL